jgi:RNA polymerase sigma-70 factor, ECF subfamily
MKAPAASYLPEPMPAFAASPDDLAPLAAASHEAPADHASDPDAALMLEAGRGSEAAFAELVRRNQNALLNFFARMGASSDGEDLVQETFVRLFRYRQRYRPTARFAAFLYHLARQVWADRGRKIVRTERLAAAYESELQARGGAAAEPRGEPADIEAALARLSPKLREVIVLNIYQGLRYQEVADALGIPLGTVKSRISLALGALREVLRES